ncbi:antitoxin [Nocardia sp. CA2R105]|uniref:antitoxin n=1 Tax=Nocardia coffeae TaxID=2873381 RepID=UPI001CA76573|nr:antitoxin [Nocardia coffeae]MBY8855569.1 antitoxin [Nocardia coffeae]
MSTQITVRLSDEMVMYLDRTVSSGQAPSRAAIVAQALERDRLRRAAERDAEILAAAGVDPDMDALARFAADTPLDDLG